MNSDIDRFLSGSPFAVVGASANRDKFGNKVLRCYLQHNLSAYPVNPAAETIEGLQAYSNLSSLPERVHGISIITPPQVTEAVVEEAGTAGIENIWMQPGAESESAIKRARELGMNVIAGGPCILVELGYQDTA